MPGQNPPRKGLSLLFRARPLPFFASSVAKEPGSRTFLRRRARRYQSWAEPIPVNLNQCSTTSRMPPRQHSARSRPHEQLYET
jgi:hypothetical protein